MKNKVLGIIYIILAVLCCAYDVILNCLSPGTFLDILFSFTHIWVLFGGIFAFFAIYRLKKNHSFWIDCKKKVKVIILSVFGIGILISSINLFFILTPKTCSITDDVDYVIVLGGGIDKKGRLPDSVQLRVNKAAEYLLAHPDVKCVVTGGTLKWLPFAEAPELKNQLVLAGVSGERILVEDQAEDTIQNFKYSCQMLANEDEVLVDRILESKVLVVTNHFHLARAERIARRLGFKNIYGLPAKIPAIKVPHSYLREICSYIKLNARILLTGEPNQNSIK